MKLDIKLSIAGLGVILFSPFAVRHINEGDDYLATHFWEPKLVADHVMDCQITAFATGSPGDYRIRLIDGCYPEEVRSAMAAVRLGIEIRDNTLCLRDLYDLMEWKRECPSSQAIAVANGFYLLTVFTQLPASGIIGDNQTITIHFQPVPQKPELKWNGVPDLSGE